MNTFDVKLREYATAQLRRARVELRQGTVKVRKKPQSLCCHPLLTRDSGSPHLAQWLGSDF
jgi:hypothetical protein